MEQLLQEVLKSSWPMVAIVVLWGYFLSKYFMQQIDKKDTQNQSNLDKFISLVEKSNEVMSKVGTSLDTIHPKLNDMHEDIKSLKNR